MKSVGARELKNRLSEYLREVQSGEAILVTDRGDVVANRWKKAVRLVAKIHRRIFNQRNDFEHKLSREIVKKYGIIVVEDLACAEACWRNRCTTRVGRHFFSNCLTRLKVPEDSSWWSLPMEPASVVPCGAPNPKRLNDREHVCVECGLVTTRDHASALEILRLGLSLLALTQPEVRVIVA